MGVRERGKSFQMDFVYKGVRYRKDKPTRQAAEECEVQAKARLLQGLDPFPEDKPAPEIDQSKLFGPTCQDVYDLEWSKQKDRRNTYLRMMQVREDLGEDTPLADLTTDRLDQYTVELHRKGNSPSTANRKLSIVSKVLKFAYRRGHLDRMPYIPRQSEPPSRFRWYTEEEQKDILFACQMNNHKEFEHLITLLFGTGMRISEALDLKMDNILFESNMIVLHEGETKNNTARSIPMTKQVRRVVDERVWANRYRAGNPLFHMSYDTACREWHRVRESIGMGKGDIMHAIRHTFCSRLSQNGADMRVIQELAGHKDLSTTQRYTHLNTEKLKADMEKLEACQQIDEMLQ